MISSKWYFYFKIILVRFAHMSAINLCSTRNKAWRKCKYRYIYGLLHAPCFTSWISFCVSVINSQMQAYTIQGTFVCRIVMLTSPNLRSQLVGYEALFISWGWCMRAKTKHPYLNIPMQRGRTFCRLRSRRWLVWRWARPGPCKRGSWRRIWWESD